MNQPTALLLSSISLSLLHSATAQTSISFDFKSGTSIGGDSALGSTFRSTVDGATAATNFDLGSLLPGLELTVTPAQSDISNTNSGLGIDTSGTLSLPGDSISFSFNQAISFDFLDVGAFTAANLDEVLLSYSNLNPSISLSAVNGDFDDNSSDTINFFTDNALLANESFTLGWAAGGGFTWERFDITVVPEPSMYAFLAGASALGLVILTRRFK